VGPTPTTCSECLPGVLVCPAHLTPCGGLALTSCTFCLRVTCLKHLYCPCTNAIERRRRCAVAALEEKKKNCLEDSKSVEQCAVASCPATIMPPTEVTLRVPAVSPPTELVDLRVSVAPPTTVNLRVPAVSPPVSPLHELSVSLPLSPVYQVAAPELTSCLSPGPSWCVALAALQLSGLADESSLA